ncbi:topoisomerase DNA-binding C4 zinc finger domain-containing protein [Pseudomonas putida]|uniref:topoisomerase DNA-binding C4 zinc finger domain-containing protein n=1 Tax=Pseudomonas putida TaxID=303 RepID=UPI003CFBFB1B
MILLSILFGPAVCSDGWASPSIGRRGACSYHGGVDKTAGVIKLLLSIGATCWAVFAYSTGREKWLAKRRDASEAAKPATVENSAVTQGIKPPPTAAVAPRTKRPLKVKCPICGGAMSIRTAKVGKNAGGKFWGCKRFPRCKGTRPHYPDVCN